MDIRKAKITDNGTEYYFNMTEHFKVRLQGRFGEAGTSRLKATLTLLERDDYDFGGNEEFVVRDFSNNTVVVYSESYRVIDGVSENVIELITAYIDKNGSDEAETYQQAPYSRVIVYDKNGELVAERPMEYEAYLSWFQGSFGRSSAKSWKWPDAWKSEEYISKKAALRKNEAFCKNIAENLKKYPAPTNQAEKNIRESAK